MYQRILVAKVLPFGTNQFENVLGFGQYFVGY
jgi:hypothetical protein